MPIAHEKQSEKRIKGNNRRNVDIIPEEDDEYIPQRPPPQMVRKYKISKNKKQNELISGEQHPDEELNKREDRENLGLGSSSEITQDSRKVNQEEIKFNYGGEYEEEGGDSFEQGLYIYIYIYITQNGVYGTKYILRYIIQRNILS